MALRATVSISSGDGDRHSARGTRLTAVSGRLTIPRITAEGRR